MADIRINALATTAASTASDDFIAVDGSANGTRKLNAYSPTFGGNLTVSGTGTSSIGGNTKIGNPANANQRLVVDGAVAGVGAITTNTGLSGGYLYSDGGTGGVVAAWNGGNYSALSILGSTVTIGTGASGTTAATISSSGNFLIGTTTDGGQKLQVKGGNAYTLLLTNSGEQYTQLLFERNGTNTGGDILIDGTGATFNIRSLMVGSMVFKTSATAGAPTTALTLDSSQNATFAGDLTVSGSNVGVGTAASAAIGIYFDSNALTGTTLSGILSAPTFANNGSPTLGRAIYGAISVQNAAYTLATGYALHVGASSVGSSATLTTAVGLRVENQGSPGAGTTTHAYGIDIAAQSGAATTNVAIRAAGKIMFTSLPTSSAGLASGELWNDGGTVKIV